MVTKLNKNCPEVNTKGVDEDRDGYRGIVIDKIHCKPRRIRSTSQFLCRVMCLRAIDPGDRSTASRVPYNAGHGRSDLKS